MPEPRHICETCGNAGRFDYPPSPGGPEDGVYCQSREIAEQNECLEEYEAEGSALLWRLEVVGPEDAQCEEWLPKQPAQLAGH